MPCEVRLYDRLFAVDHPATREDVNFIDELNPNSLEVLTEARVESSVIGTPAGRWFQFERNGYFYTDKDTTPDHIVFNRVVTLKDTWAKIASQSKNNAGQGEGKK